jgi:hypothetical protein
MMGRSRIPPPKSWTDREVANLLEAACIMCFADGRGYEQVRPLAEEWQRRYTAFQSAADGATDARDSTRRALKWYVPHVKSTYRRSFEAYVQALRAQHPPEPPPTPEPPTLRLVKGGA